MTLLDWLNVEVCVLHILCPMLVIRQLNMLGLALEGFKPLLLTLSVNNAGVIVGVFRAHLTCLTGMFNWRIEPLLWLEAVHLVNLWHSIYIRSVVLSLVNWRLCRI